METMGITMNDIARAADASVTTVGRVIHNSGYVSKEVRARVEKAIAALGYVPDRTARALKGGRSGVIGSLVRQNDNGLYYRINDSIIRAAREAGYELLTMEAQPDLDNEGRLIDNFIGLHVDGLVITSDPNVTPAMFIRLANAGIPAVAVERGYLDQGIDSLIVRDYDACRDAVTRIIRAGHRRVAVICSRRFTDVETQRCEGSLAAFKDAGIEPDEKLIKVVPGYDTQYGRIAAEELFSSGDIPTAVFATADSLAAGVLQAAYAHRLRVPDDVSVVGYDDVLSQSLSPAINSVGLFVESIGANVMDLLIRRMEDPDRPAQKRMIDTVYADRGSLAVRGDKKETVITF